MLAPAPKLASSTGALCSPAAEADATTTSTPAAPAPTGTSRLAATPWARKAAHMSGSHPTVSALLSWLAAQVAACVRTVPAAPRAQTGGTACGRDAEAVRVDVPLTWTMLTTAAAATTTQTVRISASRGCRSRAARRPAHRLTVVANTRPHDGAPGSVLWAAGLTACRVCEPANCLPIPFAPTAGLSGPAEHTPSPLSTEMPDCIRGATARCGIIPRAGRRPRRC